MDALLKDILTILEVNGLDIILIAAIFTITAVVKDLDKRKTKKLDKWYFALPFVLALVMCALKNIVTPPYAFGVVWVADWLRQSFVYGALPTGAYKLWSGFKKQRKP